MSKGYKAPAMVIKLSEGGEVPRQVQLLRTGNFKDPRYGRFKITSDMLLAMKTNFDNGVVGIDPAIDYAHESDKVAAGWPKSLELREGNSQLWADVEWTPRGNKVLAEKEFRYISSEFSSDFTDNESGKSYGPTLKGAGLTNRPVIKGMAPAVELSETTEKESDMKTELEIAQARVKELETQAATAAAKETKLAEEKKAADAKIAEFEAKELKLAEDKKVDAKKAQFDKFLSEGKLVEAQREAFMKDDTVKLAELAGKVNLDGKGHGGEGDDKDAGKQGKDVTDQVLELAEKKCADKSASSLGAAISMVLSEKPELRKQYEAATTSK